VATPPQPSTAHGLFEYKRTLVLVTARRWLSCVSWLSRAASRANPIPFYSDPQIHTNLQLETVRLNGLHGENGQLLNQDLGMGTRQLISGQVKAPALDVQTVHQAALQKVERLKCKQNS